MRGVLAFFIGLGIIAVQLILGIILGVIMGIVSVMMGIEIVTDSSTFIIAGHLVSIMFIGIPYMLIVTIFFYLGFTKRAVKKYKNLGGPIAAGIFCWLFNVFSLPYYLLTMKDPEAYESEPSGQFNLTKFVVGWFLGGFIYLSLTTAQVFTQMK